MKRILLPIVQSLAILVLLIGTPSLSTATNQTTATFVVG